MEEEKEDNLKTLSEMLDKEGIEHIYRKHPIVEREPQSFDLLGYWVTGEHQILVKTKGHNISIIRGYASFGNFEMIKEYGENMRDLWQVIEALLDDAKAAAWQEGYDEGYDCRIDENLVIEKTFRCRKGD